MKEIILTQGKVALVDDQDYDYLNQFSWNCYYKKSIDSYYCAGFVYIDDIAVRCYMHRLILNAKKGELVDHINHNTLDNTRKNLRITTASQNQRNQRLRKNSISGCIGVIWNENVKKWTSQINIEKRTVNLGNFKNKEDAIKARKEASLKYGYHENHGIII